MNTKLELVEVKNMNFYLNYSRIPNIHLVDFHMEIKIVSKRREYIKLLEIFLKIITHLILCHWLLRVIMKFQKCKIWLICLTKLRINKNKIHFIFLIKSLIRDRKLFM